AGIAESSALIRRANPCARYSRQKVCLPRSICFPQGSKGRCCPQCARACELHPPRAIQPLLCPPAPHSDQSQPCPGEPSQSKPPPHRASSAVRSHSDSPESALPWPHGASSLPHMINVSMSDHNLLHL